ncbi:MAG: hypothetical protein DRN15_00410 [Thermoprotei archaeon]|nr:MAG: hypothetical protein DRN15_00410 [Thermoprotei archaeon]
MSEEPNLYEAVLELQKNVDKVFKSFLARMPTPDNISDIVYEPPIDLIDLGDSLLLIVDVPGFRRSEVRIKVTDTSVEIRGTRAGKSSGYRYIMRQRIYNKIHKRVLLPVRIKPHEVKAILKGGVLEIYLPKAEGGEEVEVAVD